MKTLHAITGRLPTGLGPFDYYTIEIQDVQNDDQGTVIFRARLRGRPEDWFNFRFRTAGTWTEADLRTVREWPQRYSGEYYMLTFTGTAIMSGGSA